VKVCSLYGAGYYYMPGTDICLKIGGYVRYQATFNPGSTISVGPLSGTGGRNTRIDSDQFAQRVRPVITIDTRQQTQYGVLRTYLLLGYQQDTTAVESTAPGVYMTRGFIQIAGFTFGKATSFFDIYPNASFAYNAGMMHVPDTGDAGKILATYTAQFGNGVSLSIGIEAPRVAGVANVQNGTAAVGVFVPGTTPAINMLGGLAGTAVDNTPDIVGNLRMDQAWGSILAALALHNASGGYYGSTLTGSMGFGHPGDKWGWAATFGAIFNLPMIAPGDRFSFQFVYANGATKYASVTPGGAAALLYGKGSIGYGFYEDAVFGCTGVAVGGSCTAASATAAGGQLTTAWSLGAAIEHLWTPALRTSVYGSYLNITHNSTAKALMCTTTQGAFGTSGVGCNPDWSMWMIGSRTQWEPVKQWIIGVDVLYQSMKSATPSAGTVIAANGAQPAIATIGNQSAWVFTFRTQRDYHP
jgi:hypothetical protein